MSSVYSPTPVALGDITLIDDGDPKDAAGINTPIEAVADGVAYVQSKLHSSSTPVTVTSSSTITVPAGAKWARVEMCGGGGGGGGGAAGMASLRQCAGGGGGGGAPLVDLEFAVTAGEGLAVVIGAGGTGGTGGTTPTSGGDGGNTTITRVTGSVLLGTAAGGGGGSTGATVANGCAYGQGGDSPRMNPSAASEHNPIAETSVEVFGLYRNPAPQAGAYGRSNNDQADPSGATAQPRGGSSPQGFRGGPTGFKAVGDDSGYFNGGSGGGGGAGPYAHGPAGGAGGLGHSGAAGGNGSAGGAGTANTGNGGGGGGAAGAGTSSGSAGAGGVGGSGLLTITYFGDL